MVVVPTGTVTLLFSYVEGSTAPLSRRGPAYEEALQGHREVLRKAMGSHGGVELGTEGDGFFAVFTTAQSAVSAASQAQQALAPSAWYAGEWMPVRMGIHTGMPRASARGYVGVDMDRAARIASA